MASGKFTPPSGREHPPTSNGKIGGVHSVGPCGPAPGNNVVTSNQANAVTRPPHGVPQK